MTAKEMFEKLGWRVYEEKNGVCCEPNSKGYDGIFFDECHQIITMFGFDCEISKELLKSIIQMAKELGWLE